MEPLQTQIGGNHYKKLSYQPIAFIAKLHLSFSQGCIVKYVSRYKDKNGLEDLKKAIHYCQLANKLSDASKHTKLLRIMRPKFVKRETLKYILCNSLEGYAGFCIEHIVLGNFKEAESNLHSLIATEYSL